MKWVDECVRLFQFKVEGGRCRRHPALEMKEWNLEFFYLFLEACGYATDAATASLMALEMYTYFEKKELFGNLDEADDIFTKSYNLLGHRPEEQTKLIEEIETAKRSKVPVPPPPPQ